jgi:outer membrane protein assembly factor BamE (lipoprotein component of BamABCDE complex)
MYAVDSPRGKEIGMVRLVGVLALAALLAACSASQHRAEVQDPVGDELTVGTVQKEIRVGMSGAEVAEVLGSPNIVSTDENRREVWIYDKVSTETAYSTSNALVLGGLVSSGGAGAGVFGKNAGAASTSQKTLTVIIKFDDNRLVRDFAFHSSKF